MSFVTPSFFLYLLVMAGVTYLIRMLPLAFFRRRIRSRLVRSFLYYVPYAVLTAMTVPAIFYSTSYVTSAAIGFAVSMILAYLKRSLITVAAAATVTVLLTELVIPYLPFFIF